MKNLSEYKNQYNHLILTISLVLVILFFGIDFSIEYATDTYATFMDNSVWEYMLHENGRVINAAVYWIFYQLSPSPKLVYFLSYISALIFTFLSVYLYGLLLNSFIHNEYYSAFLSFFILVNPFSIEYYLYIEKGLFLFSLFCVILALNCLNNYFNFHHKQQIYIAFLFLLASVLCYQITIGIFVICAIPLLVKNFSSKTEFIVRNITVAFLYGASLGCSYIITSFCLHSSRIESAKSFAYVLENTLKNIIHITKNSYYHLPNNYLLYCYLVSFLVIIFLFLQSHQKVRFFFTISYGVVAVIFVSFFPFFSGVTTGFACRTVYPYGCIWGILIVLALQLNYNNHTPETINISQDTIRSLKPLYKIWLPKILSLLVLLLLIEQYLLFQQVFLDRYKGNQTDKYICQMIGERIQNYENSTGKTITTICFYKDQALTWGIDGTFQNGLLDRAHATGWSNLASINYFLNKDYSKGTPNEDYIKLFQDKNWNFYSDEQLIFEGDTLHFCVY